jgi:hypothetical protein
MSAMNTFQLFNFHLIFVHEICAVFTALVTVCAVAVACHWASDCDCGENLPAVALAEILPTPSAGGVSSCLNVFSLEAA